MDLLLSPATDAETIAARQWGVVSWAQLRFAGVREREIEAWERDERVWQLFPCVYVLGADDVPREGRWLGATLAYGPRSVLAGGSAAALWGLLPDPPGPIEVASPRLTDRGIAAIRPRRAMVAAEDRGVCRGIPVTTPARTLLDLCASGATGAASQALEQMRRRGLDDGDAIAGVLERHRGRPGIRRLRSLLEGSHAAERPRGTL